MRYNKIPCILAALEDVGSGRSLEVYYKNLSTSKLIVPIMAYTKKNSYDQSPAWVTSKILCEIAGVDTSPGDTIVYKKYFRTYNDWYHDCIFYITLLRRIFGERMFWVVDAVFPKLEQYMGNYIFQVFHGELFNIGNSYFEYDKINSFHRYSLILAYGQLMKDKIVEKCAISPDDKRLKLIGRVLNDQLYTGKINKRDILVSYGLHPQRKTILYAPTWCSRRIISVGKRKDDQKNFQALCHFTKRMGVNLIVRPHTISINHFYAKSRYLRIVKKFDNIYFDDTTNYSIDGPNKSIAASDILITDLSSVSIDFMSLGKPAIFLYPDGNSDLWGEMPTREEVSALSYTVDRMADLFTCLSKLLTQPEDNQTLVQREKFTSYAISTRNGNSGKLFCDALENFSSTLRLSDFANIPYIKGLGKYFLKTYRPHVPYHMKAQIYQL